MKVKFDLSPPEEWQQFEAICKKVWGTIWSIPNEIDFNSTNGQGQQGVDIVGIPKGENSYFGVQCKNKRLHLKSGIKNKITTVTIDEEIEKASLFIPSLQHLVIATSLYRDREVEEYVRIKNLEQINASKFSVQICFWEYISEVIQDNQQLYNWYIGERNYHSSHQISVLLDNEQAVKSFSPTFTKEKRIYRHETEVEYTAKIQKIQETFEKLKTANLVPLKSRLEYFFHSLFRRKSIDKNENVTILVNGKPLQTQYPIRAEQPNAIINYGPSYEIYQGCYFGFVLKNIGPNVIEDFKLSFSLEGDFEEFDIEAPTLTEIARSYPINSWKTDHLNGYIEPDKNFLIQSDSFESTRFYVLPQKNMPSEIKIKWQLLARDFSDNGTLILQIEPQYRERESVWYIDPKDEPYEKYFYHNMTKEGVRPIHP